MLKPADGEEGVKNAVLTAVKEAGPNACPPMVVGVGIGGTFEKCALLAKQALTRPLDQRSEIPWVRVMEEELLERINRSESALVAWEAPRPRLASTSTPIRPILRDFLWR